MRWLILCDGCVDEIDEDQITGLFQAKFGYQETEEETEGCVLACIEWYRPHKPDAQMFFCDECGEAIAVDKSSQWFVDEHRKERDEETA